jgi:hypothetical protein
MDLLKRFPPFELSYETISHKKVPDKYDLCLAIPTGKKVFIWFTFHQNDNVCFLLDINKERRIYQSTKVNLCVTTKLSLGTILYGTIIIDEATNMRRFIAEDIFYYSGISLKNSKIKEKLSFLKQFMDAIANENKNKDNDIRFYLPVMWKYDNSNGTISDFGRLPNEIKTTTAYVIHHIQYRSLNETMPFLNFLLSTNINVKSASTSKNNQLGTTISSEHKFEVSHNKPDFMKPQYKYPTVFRVTADIQFDIYHLFAYGKNKTSIYYNIAHIPNYDKSVFMNSLFRNIRENKNIDYIEESDDDDDFENTKIDKYVNINKVLLMECIFSNKFKKWIPVKVVDDRSKVVHISQL